MSNLPKLRFSGFSGEWGERPLKLACQMQAGSFIKASEIYERKDNELYPCYGGNGLRGFTKTYTHTGRYSLIGRQGALCGNITLATGSFHATEHAIVTTPINNTDTDWLFYQLINLNLNQHATGQAQPGLSVKNLEEIEIKVPKEKKEQQKIANCLSSIDQVITAQSQKLDTLKAHKKGLMQQLFPAEGETIPKLRFPEFRDAGDWGAETLGSLTTRIGDGIHSTPTYDANGSFFFINGNNLIDGRISISESTKKVSEKEALIHSRDLSNRTILLSINGTIGNLAFYNGENVMLGKSAAYINVNNSVDIMFIYNTLKTAKVQGFFTSELTGSTIKNLSLKTIRETKVSIPSLPEQQKIANCLSVADDLITAQAQKVESLKAHKKGLMQQLFPQKESNL